MMAAGAVLPRVLLRCSSSHPAPTRARRNNSSSNQHPQHNNSTRALRTSCASRAGRGLVHNSTGSGDSSGVTRRSVDLARRALGVNAASSSSSSTTTVTTVSAGTQEKLSKPLELALLSASNAVKSIRYSIQTLSDDDSEEVAAELKHMQELLAEAEQLVASIEAQRARVTGQAAPPASSLSSFNNTTATATLAAATKKKGTQ